MLNTQPYLLSGSERLRQWKLFRETFTDDQTDEEQLLQAENYWRQYPYVERNLDPYDSETWPTPWEILHSDGLCKVSVAYLIEQTLLFADDRWTQDRFNLMYIRDRSLSAEFMILVVDTKYVVNYSLNEIVNYDNIKIKCDILQKYSLNDKKHLASD
jgi:hypothetical protein